MNTAVSTYTSIVYRPVPTPPKITSPSRIKVIGTAPPSGVNESCMALTAPHEVPVVMAANKVDATTPKRVSLPSKLPTSVATPAAVSLGFGVSSA